MDYRNEIEDLLTGLSGYKRQLSVVKEVGGKSNQLEKKVKFLEFCLSLLETYQKELVLSVYTNGISIRKYSDHTGLSRNFISKEKQRVIDEFNKYFEIKYSSK